MSGCSIKESDTTQEKFLKHTANTPIYIVFGAAASADFLLKCALLPPFAAYNYLTRDANTSELAPQDCPMDDRNQTIEK